MQTRRREGMFCGSICWHEWCTQVHFINVTWKLPRYSHAHAESTGSILQM